MRCGCPECGVYMIQRERGLQSHCVCPSCGNACSACMGGSSLPATRQALLERFSDEDESTASQSNALPIPTRRNRPSLSERGKTPMDAALKHLALRMRSVREMELYLDQEQYGEYEISQAIDRLTELGYLNDAAYASEFIRTRLATKPVSRRKLHAQLRQHFIEDAVIENALMAVPSILEKENALAMAKKFAPQMRALPPKEKQERLMRRLLSRGYSPEDAKEAVHTAFMEET